MKQIQTTFQDLIERSYSAIKKRGLIDENTIKIDFIEKMNEELEEIEVHEYNNPYESGYIEECVDLATVCIMQIKHLGYNFEDEFLKGIEKNETRAKNGK